MTVVATILVFVGLAVLTIGQLGVARLGDTASRLHSAAMAPLLGVGPLLLALMLSGELDLLLRALLVGAVLLITGAIGGHAVARAGWRDAQRPRRRAARSDRRSAPERRGFPPAGSG